MFTWPYRSVPSNGMEITVRFPRCIECHGETQLVETIPLEDIFYCFFRDVPETTDFTTWLNDHFEKWREERHLSYETFCQLTVITLQQIYAYVEDQCILDRLNEVERPHISLDRVANVLATIR